MCEVKQIRRLVDGPKGLRAVLSAGKCRREHHRPLGIRDIGIIEAIRVQQGKKSRI